MIYVTKTHEDSKIPTKAHYHDAGFDLYARIDKDKIIYPGESVVIGTGIKVSVTEGYVMQICNRSGLASKHQLFVGAEIVDPGYSNEVFVNLHNLGKLDYTIKNGDRIAQFLVYQVSANMLELDPQNYKTKMETFERGMGGFGSSGK